MPELQDFTQQIERLAASLETDGNQIRDIADRMQELKRQLEVGERETMFQLFNTEQGGKIERPDGETIKLTDAMREQIANFGQINARAEYEGLKRKLDALKTAVSAKQAALSGYQSLTAVARKEIELEMASYGPQSRYA